METTDNLTNYLIEGLPKQSQWVKRLECYAKEHRIPIMDPVSIHFLMQLIRMKKPAKILEIGTAIGYSALRMNEACPSAHITTIERDETNYNLAIRYIKELKKEHTIKVIYGDARDVLDRLTTSDEHTSYDIVFIDAAKAQYQSFFELARPLLHSDGIIITDNVLFKGYVVEERIEHKRFNKLAKKIRHYNAWLTSQKDFATSIVPIGDGVAISVRI